MGAPAYVAGGMVLKGLGVLFILAGLGVAVASAQNVGTGTGLFFVGIIMLIVGHVVKSAGKHAKHVVEVQTQR